jgi:hypothetical protein
MKQKSKKIIIIAVVLVASVVVANIFSTRVTNAGLESDFKKIALLPAQNTICTYNLGGNESNLSAATYGKWYNIQDEHDLVRNLQATAKKAGYDLMYIENAKPYVPKDLTIRKFSGTTSVPSREPNYTLKGKNRENDLTLVIEGYRGDVNPSCKPDISRTVSSSAGGIILFASLKKV